MKRTFTFLMSLFLTIGAMWAQTVVTTINPDKFYTLECKSEYAHNTNRFIGDDGTVINGQSATAAFFKFEVAENGYYIYSLASGKYLNSDGNTVTASADTKTVWKLNAPTHTASVVTFEVATATDKYLNNNGTKSDGTCNALQPNSHGGGPGSGNACSLWEICEYDNVLATYDITYNFTYEGTTVATQKAIANEGDAYPDYNVALPYGFVAAAKPEGTVEEAKTIEVALTVEKALPVEAAETVEGITKWYYVKMHANNPKYIQALEDGTIEWLDAEVAEGEEESHLWGFVVDAWGMKLVSKTGKAVVSTAGNAQLGDAAQATTFFVTGCKGDEDAFCLQYPDKVNYLNAQNGIVSSWHDNDAGSGFLVELYEEPVVDPNDYTSYIKNADLSKSSDSDKVWNTDGTKGISGGMVKVGSGSTFDFSQTITLPAGQYKMTAKAAYRYSGSEADEFTAIEAGTETHYAKLYAETAYKNYEVNVMNRYDGASVTDLAGNGAVEVNGKYVPNSSAAVQAWFDKGQYVNELVFNVQEESEVKIGIAKTESPEAGDYANIGAWTLTRLGDAEFDLNEEDFDLDAPAYTDVTSDYIVNADLTSKDGWTVSGLENDGKFDVNLKAVEFYSGWGALERPNGHLTQEVTLPAGTYRLTGKAFFRQGNGPQDNPGKSLGYLVAGENKVLVKTLGSANGTANDFTVGANTLYADATFDNVLEFILTEETKLTIGYETTFDEMRSWFIVGAVKLESVQAVPGALVPLFEAQATEFCQYSSQAMSDLPAVNAKWEALCSTVLEIDEAITANERVLDVEVKRVMDEMTAMTTELKAIEDVYATYNETKFDMFDIQDNSTPNNAEVKAAFDAAVDAASNVNKVATVAELEAKIAEFEAARQAYVLNAVPAEGFTFDYTFLIANPSFETGDLSGWTVRRYSAETDVRTDGAAGVDGRYCFNSWWNGVYLTQDLVDIPDGVYRLTVALFGGDSGNDATAYIVANKDTLGVNLKNGTPYTDFSVETTVIDGKLHFATVGGNDDDTAENPVGSFSQDGYWWYKADNFRLTYVSELPLEIVLPMKKELFLEKYAEFEALTETLDYYWNAINENYFTVQGTALGVKDTIDEVTDVAVLENLMDEMDEVTAMLDELGSVAVEYNYFKGLLGEAVDFSTKVNEEECAAAAAALDQYGEMFGYTASSVEAVKAAVADLKASYIKFVSNAAPTEGTMFDMTFFITNASFETGDLTGWEVRRTSSDTGVRENTGDYATNGTDGKYLFNTWWAGVYLTQEAEGLPNGDYRLTVAMSGGDAGNPGTAYIIANQDTLGINMPDKTVFVDHSVNFKVTDGKLHIATVGGNDDDTAENPVGSFTQDGHWWYKADNFRIEFAGAALPVEVTEVKVTTEAGETWGDLTEVNATLQLIATVTPEDATDKTLTWTSSNPELVSVENGLITLLGECPEYTLVTITAKASNGVSGTFEVNVMTESAPVVGGVESIVFGSMQYELEGATGATLQLDYTVLPEDAEDKTITWTCSAWTELVTVSETGLVTIVGSVEDEGGMVTITATASNGVSATCYLTVTIVADDTAIDNINANAETVIYDIHGRRVEKMEKGIYIVNGKKVVKK